MLHTRPCFSYFAKIQFQLTFYVVISIPPDIHHTLYLSSIYFLILWPLMLFGYVLLGMAECVLGRMFIAHISKKVCCRYCLVRCSIQRVPTPRLRRSIRSPNRGEQARYVHNLFYFCVSL